MSWYRPPSYAVPPNAPTTPHELMRFAETSPPAEGGPSASLAEGATVLRPAAPGLARVLAAMWILCIAVYLPLNCFGYPWDGGDSGIYAAAITRLYDDFRSPGHEGVVASSRDTPNFTPYVVAVAWSGRLLGLSPYRALMWMGVVNLGAYILGIMLFFRAFARDVLVHTAVFLFVSLLVRWTTFQWSSDTNLLALRSTLTYPSFLAWAVAFICFAVFERILTSRRLEVGRTLLLAAVIGFILLTHTITASWIIVVMAGRALIELVLRGGSREHGYSRLLVTASRAAVPAVLGLSLTFAWPYFDLLGPGLATTVRVAENAPFLRDPWAGFRTLYLVLPIAIALQWRQPRTLTWTLLMVLTLILFFVYRALGMDYGARYALFAAGIAQVLVTFAICDGSRYPERLWRTGWRTLVLLVTLSGVFSPLLWRDMKALHVPLQSPLSLLRAPGAEQRVLNRWSRFTPCLGGSDVVLAPLLASRVFNDILNIVVATHARLVISPYAQRLPDRFERERVVASFYRSLDAFEATGETREGQEAFNHILQRYQPTHLLVAPGKRLPVFVAASATGCRNDEFELLKLKP